MPAFGLSFPGLVNNRIEFIKAQYEKGNINAEELGGSSQS